MKRLVLSRLGAAVAGMLLLTPLVSCGPPPPPKISAAFGKLTYAAPGPGIGSGQNANFTYKASGVPSGGSIFLQKASLSGATIRWSNVSQLDVIPLGSGTIIRPAFGRNAYRVGVFDAHGKGLTSAPLALDVYKRFTFAELTTRPVQTVKFGSGLDFKYVFQAEIFLENTSCRALGALDLFNNSSTPRKFEFAQTIKGKTTSHISVLDANPTHNIVNSLFYYGQSITPGEDLDLHILDNDIYGSNVYGNGSATCLTDTGEF
ncbi:MAG: hypothetical protein JWN96_2411 [Mycobacterium sp.]|nr:hypothetical protein [Mycobacterium sp.]